MRGFWRTTAGRPVQAARYTRFGLVDVYGRLAGGRAGNSRYGRVRNHGGAVRTNVKYRLKLICYIFIATGACTKVK